MTEETVLAKIDAELESKVRRLINNDDVQDIVEYDVSDAKLYGRRNRRKLSGEVAEIADAAGYVAEVYESVYWITLVGIPVWPRGVYLLLPRRECDDPDGDADQYRALRLGDDWRWYARHYVIGLIVLSAFIAIVAATLAKLFTQARGQ